MPARGTAPRSGRQGRVGVIDIGSNSVRLVVYDALSRAPVPLLNEKVLCGLGRGLGETGRLNQEGVESALAHLARFVALARTIGVRRLDALATAAVRDAEDGPAFAAEIRRRTGVNVQILSGEAEGRLSALGLIAGIPDASGVMGDLGGGSVELVPVRRGRTHKGATLPIGPLRLAELAEDERKLGASIEREVERVDWLRHRRSDTFYAVGGAWRALARIHMEQSHYPIHVIQGYTLPRRDAEDFLGLVARLSRRSLEQISTVSRKRLEVVPIAAEILRRIVAVMEPKRIVFSALGLREGHIYELLAERERRQDPLLVACAALAHGHPRFRAGNGEIDTWLAATYPRPDAHRRLRYAASLLGDVSWAEHPDYRAEQAFRTVLYMPAAGLSHRERAFLAVALHARYGGPESAIRDTVSRLIDDDALADARRTGLALRLAYTISGGVPGLLRRASLALERGELVLRVPGRGPLQGGEAVERRLGALARAFGVEARIRSATGAGKKRPSARGFKAA
ncbi:MAG TPA: Ppx/GppA family phosphatase [Stellaceae bacterium]|nr:Ppx/GppA family phosphatase [Stellaceae bacterium]